MPSSDTNIRDVSGNVNVIQSSGNIYGDIVAGDKTVINNIIQQAAKQIVAAPYKFLNSYDIGDRDIFFGRDAVIEELAGKLLRYKTLVINGRSGSGKTSLINAGLIPRLAENGYHYLSFRDYSDPLRQLREHVAQNDLFKAYADQTASLFQFLNTVTRQKQQQIVVIFDQFERFFVNVLAATQMQFIQEIKACLDSDLTSRELGLIFAVREDFYGQFSSEFETAIPTFRCEMDLFHLRLLTRKEAREAIMNPLRNVAHKIWCNKDFVDEVLLPGLIGESSSQDEIDPPHIQIVCNQLYQAALRRYAAELAAGDGVQIDRQLYKSLGETQGILRSYLDEFIDRAAQQNTARRKVFHSMLKLMVETTGTRKFRSLQELQRGLPDIAPEQVTGYIQTLQTERIIETRRQDDIVRYSLSHEVMVEKVQSWSDKREFERKKAKEILEHGIAGWKITEALLNEKQVKHIRTWLGGEVLGEQEEQLLTQSQQAYEKRKCQMRRSRVMVSALGLFLLIAAGIIFWQYTIHKKLWQPVYADDSVLSLAAATIDGTSPIYYAGTKNQGIVWSQNGVTWNLSNTGLPTVKATVDGKTDTYVQGIMRLGVDILNPRRVFAAVHGSGIYRNQDLLQPWEPVNTGLPAQKGTINDLDVRGECLITVIADYPKSVLYASTDGGEHWEFANGQETFALPIVQTVSIAPGIDQLYGNADDLVYVGTDKGIYWNSIQPPWQWRPLLPTTEPVMQIIPATDKDNVYYVTIFSNSQATTIVYEWHIENNTLHEWATLAVPPMVLIVPPISLVSVKLFGLLGNGEIIAITQEGRIHSLGKHSGFGQDLFATQHPGSGKVWLLFAHDDGLLEYRGNVDLTKK